MHEQLIDYVKKARERGITDEVIRNNLLGQGWSTNDVESSMGVHAAPQAQAHHEAEQLSYRVPPTSPGGAMKPVKKAWVGNLFMVIAVLVAASSVYYFMIRPKYMKKDTPNKTETTAVTPEAAPTKSADVKELLASGKIADQKMAEKTDGPVLYGLEQARVEPSGTTSDLSMNLPTRFYYYASDNSFYEVAIDKEQKSTQDPKKSTLDKARFANHNPLNLETIVIGRDQALATAKTKSGLAGYLTANSQKDISYVIDLENSVQYGQYWTVRASTDAAALVDGTAPEIWIDAISGDITGSRGI